MNYLSGRRAARAGAGAFQVQNVAALHRYHPDASFGKQVGVEQAEHRVSCIVSRLAAVRDAARAANKPELARRMELERAGAAAALDAIHELLRNYQGCE